MTGFMGSIKTKYGLTVIPGLLRCCGVDEPVQFFRRARAHVRRVQWVEIQLPAMVGVFVDVGNIEPDGFFP